VPIIMITIQTKQNDPHTESSSPPVQVSQNLTLFQVIYTKS